MLAAPGSYVPGWDCHGLPIEIKALERLPARTTLAPRDIRRHARQLCATRCASMPASLLMHGSRPHDARSALETIDKQCVEFRSWAVLGDWDAPYRTLGASARDAALIAALPSPGHVH